MKISFKNRYKQLLQTNTTMSKKEINYEQNLYVICEIWDSLYSLYGITILWIRNLKKTIIISRFLLWLTS